MFTEIDDALLWSDEHVLVVNKPAGLLCNPDGYNPDLPHLTAAFQPKFGELWVVHRLDRDTSGVVMLARTGVAHRDLCQMFERRQVTKIYNTLVNGNPAWDTQTVEQPLRVNGDRQHRTVVDYQGGKFAHTQIFVRERFGRCTLVEARPETGRTHQIRVHLREIGTPVIADGLYGEGGSLFLSEIKSGYRKNRSRTERPLLERLGLHARSLTIKHPFSGSEMYFEAPYPKDLAIALRQLRRYSNSSR